MSPDERPLSERIRREPPRFRRVSVQQVARVGPRMISITLGGPDLEGLTVAEPAASVRLLLPASQAHELVIPAWNGNEFLLPDGSRPIIRTFTPYRVDTDASTLEVWAVVHGAGPASEWANAAGAGDAVAVSGPGRGYVIDRDVPAFVLAGDETAIPAMCQLLERLPEATPVQLHIEVAHPDGRLALPGHPAATVTWWDLPVGATPGDALVEAMVRAEIDPRASVWVAGEAAAVQRIRRNLFDDRAMTRSRATVRGYWKHGRGGDPD